MTGGRAARRQSWGYPLFVWQRGSIRALSSRSTVTLSQRRLDRGLHYRADLPRHELIVSKVQSFAFRLFPRSDAQDFLKYLLPF